jgi:hypothetical protein
MTEQRKAELQDALERFERSTESEIEADTIFAAVDLAVVVKRVLREERT